MPIAKYSRYLLPIQCFLFLFLWACNFPFTSCICAGSSCEVFSWIWAEHKTEENPNEFSNSLFIYLCVCVCVCVCVCIPRWCSSGKESACQCRRCRFNPWVKKIPWRRAWLPTPVYLPGESHRQRHLAGYCPWGLTRLNTTEVT